MPKAPLTIPTAHGDLAGWVAGELSAPAQRRVLLLHGGPGLSYDYLEDQVAPDIGDGWTIAAFQQRGLTPSTTAGPFDVSTALGDIGAVLDALGWDRSLLLGHSWGGHLALHAAVTLPDRLLGVLAVDPLGVVDGGGVEQFSAELRARVSPDTLPALDEVGKRFEDDVETDDDQVEMVRLLWPSYFADPASAPAMPTTRCSLAAGRGLWDSLEEQLPTLEAALPGIRVPLGVLMGGRSPMPTSAGSDVVDRVPGAWLEVIADAGHFTWVESPGCLRAGLDRLVG